jgi:hypothetical protein
VSKLQSMFAILSSGVAGAVSAAIITVTMASSESTESTPTDRMATAAVGSAAAEVGPRHRRTAADDTRLVRLERELHGLRAQLDDGERVSSRDEWTQIDLEPSGSPPDPEESLEAARGIWDVEVEAHEVAPFDAQWSQQARSSFERDLAEALGDQGVDISVDCRTESCLASVGFASYRDATASFSTLLQHSYGLNCERTVAMPPPDDPGGSYDAEILFVCPGGASI